MRLQPRLGGADQDAAALLAAHDLVRRGGLHAGPVAAGQLEAAALAAAVAQHRRADPAAALADLVVEGDEVGGQVGGERAAAGPAELLVLGDAGEGLVAAALGLGAGGPAGLQG